MDGMLPMMHYKQIEEETVVDDSLEVEGIKDAWEAVA